MTYLERAHYGYYVVARAWVRMLSPGSAILDVGARDSPVATWGEYANRYTVDRDVLKARPGVNTYRADWMQWKVPETMHVTTCLQVIEHLTDEQLRPFVDKLFAHTKHLIISVPYEWEKGVEPDHHQDPISLEKFMDQMMPVRPLEYAISVGGKRMRLVARWEL